MHLTPHGVQIATKGFLGVTIGTSSKGFIIRIEGHEVPDESIKGGPHPDPKSRMQCITITVEAYGQNYTHEECISLDRNIKISDLEIIDNGEEIISITISGV